MNQLLLLQMFVGFGTDSYLSSDYKFTLNLVCKIHLSVFLIGNLVYHNFPQIVGSFARYVSPNLPSLRQSLPSRNAPWYSVIVLVLFLSLISSY